jgi:hypothetical protein
MLLAVRDIAGVTIAAVSGWIVAAEPILQFDKKFVNKKGLR